VVAGAPLSPTRLGAVWFRLFTLSTNLFDFHLFKRVFLFSFSFLSGLLKENEKKGDPPPAYSFFGCEISPKSQK
jgi:hypothetical protein